MTTTHQMTVRAARPDDVGDIVAIHHASRERAYSGIIPDEYVVPRDITLSHRRWQDAVAGSTAFVAELDGRVVGVAAIALPSSGPLELGALYVDPQYWGRGCGSALAERVFRVATEAGRAHVVAWVAAKSAQAKRFYFGTGWWLDGGVEVRGTPESPYVVQRFRHVAGGR